MFGEYFHSSFQKAEVRKLSVLCECPRAPSFQSGDLQRGERTARLGLLLGPCACAVRAGRHCAACCALCGAGELSLSFSLLNSTINMLPDLVSAQARVPRGCAAVYTFLVFLIELPIISFSERTGGKQATNLVKENGERSHICWSTY